MTTRVAIAAIAEPNAGARVALKRAFAEGGLRVVSARSAMSSGAAVDVYVLNAAHAATAAIVHALAATSPSTPVVLYGRVADVVLGARGPVAALTAVTRVATPAPPTLVRLATLAVHRASERSDALDSG